MALKVYIPTQQTHLSVDELRSLLPPSITIIAADSPPDPADYEILVSGFPDSALLEASPRLRAVIVPFAGTPKETIELLRDYPHISLHSSHYNVAPTAELAIGLMLAAAKFIVPLDRELRNNDWRSRYGKTRTIILAGRTATILGYGRIGKRIGLACKALGLRVLGIRRHAHAGAPVPEGDPADAIYPPSALDSLLPQSDVLFIAVPLTAETEGLIGADELAKLPRHAVLVNVGRGGVVDEAALYHALRDQQILAAGIDVWYQYPASEADRANTPPSRYPFHQLDNVVMSPHRGGWLSAAEPDRLAEVAAMLQAAAEGQPIPGEVDKTLGY